MWNSIWKQGIVQEYFSVLSLSVGIDYHLRKIHLQMCEFHKHRCMFKPYFFLTLLRK